MKGNEFSLDTQPLHCRMLSGRVKKDDMEPYRDDYNIALE